MCWLAWMVLCQATISISGYISLDIGELLSSDLWPPSRIEASKVDYDPDLAEFALDFAAASYAPDPTGCLSRHNATLIKRVTIPCDFLGNECWAYIAKSEEWIIMAIRGTVEIKQLLAEVAESAIAPKVEFPAGGNVQHYFYTSFDDLWDGANFRGIIQNLKKDNPNYKILFTGHSFGGAVASLASAMFVHENLNLKNLTKSVFSITFGQPRVGNHAYAIAHDKLVPNSWRIVHRKDIVPHIPLCLSFMGHCTTGFNLTPYHHGTEVS
uniref:Lipase_3 domain-containing protein n=1 Tax=Panagrellus redivivus TaxID=6233 RepID=A0A7E4VNW0_PANRE